LLLKSRLFKIRFALDIPVMLKYSSKRTLNIKNNMKQPEFSLAKPDLKNISPLQFIRQAIDELKK